MVTECSATTPSLANDTGSVSYVARARAHGDEHPNPTQDRQCCAMEPRGKALERGAAERAEARTVAERSTGEAGGRSKRELLLEAYYSTPPRCCSYTSALLREVTVGAVPGAL